MRALDQAGTLAYDAYVVPKPATDGSIIPECRAGADCADLTRCMAISHDQREVHHLQAVAHSARAVHTIVHYGHLEAERLTCLHDFSGEYLDLLTLEHRL
jgi:hypothetical protein